jgi:NAD(P)-dependent dehydrogenase (short-subunit alcohol dehydrogenase family)
MMREVDRVVCEEQDLAPGSFLEELADSNPMKRLATVEETAALVAFLASDEARYINGQAIEIDGGRIMS